MHTLPRFTSRTGALILLGTLASTASWAQTNANVNAHASAQAQIAVQGGINGQTGAQSSSVATRVTAATGLALSAGAQRYLSQRNPDAQPGDAGHCRDEDRTFHVEHRSYGSLSPRARRQLNDCSPSLRPVNAAP